MPIRIGSNTNPQPPCSAGRVSGRSLGTAANLEIWRRGDLVINLGIW
jgi:hypothetical protein